MALRGAVWICVLIMLNVVIILESSKHTSVHIRWTEKQLYPPSKIPDNALSPRRAAVRRKIALYHNFFRTKVKPTASNMLLMTWHTGAAKQAQRYAEKCIFLKHNNNSVPRLGRCGQNLFVSSVKTPWFTAIKNWFIEYRLFTFGSPVKNLRAVGHYTQMVWATSHKVGCGIAHCSGGPWGQFYNYVCNYCPGGNREGYEHFPYKVGESCSDCQESCVSDRLCRNSCPAVNHFDNCDDLQQQGVSVCGGTYCNATCLCGPDNRIYKIYPWT